MKFTNFLKSVLLSVLCIFFAVQVNAQQPTTDIGIYYPCYPSGNGSGCQTLPGGDGPSLTSGSAQVCEVGIAVGYRFQESNASGDFFWRIDSGSIIADPTGASLIQNINGGGYFTWGNGSNLTTPSGFSRQTSAGLFNGSPANQSEVKITWLKTGTYTLYVKRAGGAFSYTDPSNNNYMWTAFVIEVANGAPPAISGVSVTPSADSICSGTPITVQSVQPLAGNAVTGIRLQYDASGIIGITPEGKQSLEGFPSDTGSAQYLLGSLPVSFNLTNNTDSVITITYYIVPLSGTPLGDGCDGEMYPVTVSILPKVVIKVNADTLACKGTDPSVSNMINPYHQDYIYFFGSDPLVNNLITSDTIYNIMRDTTFYVRAFDARYSSFCTSDIVPINIITEYNGTLPAFKASIDTNVCLNGYVDLAGMIDSVAGTTYNIFIKADMNPVATPDNVGPYDVIEDVTYYIQAVEADGCLSEYDSITIHVVNYPQITVTPINVHTPLHDTLLVYASGMDATFEISLTEGDTSDWTVYYTFDGVANSETFNTQTGVIEFLGLDSNRRFVITGVSRQGCNTDTTIRYFLRVIPGVWMTSSTTECTRTDTLYSGETVTICEGDEQFICAWVDTLLVHSDETWGVIFTNQTTGFTTTMQFRGYDIPYNMIETQTMAPGTYHFTVDTLIISGGSLPSYIKDNALGLDYYLEIVKTPEVTVDAPVAVCSMETFEFPITITGGKDSVILSYTIDGGATMDTVLYHPANDTILASLPIPGKVAGATTTVQLLSLESVPCNTTLTPIVDYTFTFTFDTLPEVVALVSIKDTVACDWMEFEVGTKANCHIGDMVNIKFQMDGGDWIMEYYDTSAKDWLVLSNGVGGTGYFGPPTSGFPLQDLLVPGSGTQLRIKSVSPVFVDSIYYSYTIVSAADKNIAWSIPMEGYFYLLGTEAELLDLDTITQNLTVVNCKWNEFELGIRANCHKDSLSNVLIAMDVTGLALEYNDGSNWIDLTQYFNNATKDTCYFGPQGGYPLYDAVTKFRVQSATTKFIENIDYSFVIVDANDPAITRSAPITGTFDILGTEAELLDFDSITKNITAVTCIAQEFEIGIRANCLISAGVTRASVPAMVKVRVEIDTTGLLLEYYDVNSSNYVAMNPYFENGVAFYGPSTGFPIQDILQKPGSKFRISSTGNKTGIVNYLFVVVDGNTGTIPMSDTIMGTFELRALPVATITDPFNGTVCKGTTVEYVTESSMATYTWSITQGTNGVEYTYTKDDTSVFEVTWLAAGTYNVVINYTDTNGCSSSADSVVTVLEIPSASISIVNDELDVCPNTDVELQIEVANASAAGPWKVVYSALDYYDSVVKTYTADNVIPVASVATLTADGLPAGKYRFHVDTIFDLATTVTCPGFLDNDTTTSVINIYPEPVIIDITTRPAPICINSGDIVLHIYPDTSLYMEKNVAIPHYMGYKLWVEDPQGNEYPATAYPWVTTSYLEITIPASAYTLGENTFSISRIYTSINNSDTLCKFDNLGIDYTFNVLDIPVVEIVGSDTVCGINPSQIAYEYTTSIELEEYLWSFATITGTGSANFVAPSIATDSAVMISFSDTGHYQIYLAAKDSACENFDTLNIYVAPNPQLVDINDFLANLDYVNCKTQEFAIGSIAGCREGQLGKVMIVMDTTGLLLEYYETSGTPHWANMNQYFVNDTCLYGPPTGFPVVDFTSPGSQFRITSTSDVRVPSVNYTFILVDAADGRTPWSDPITGSFILTPADTAAQIFAWTLDSNVIVNCTEQMFYVEVTPNCQEGDTARIRIALDNMSDASDITWTYAYDTAAASFTALPSDYTIYIDSLIAGSGIVATDTLSRVYFKISSNNDSARDVTYNVYLEDLTGTMIWDSIVDYRIRLVKNAPLAMTIIEAPAGDSVVCFEREIKIAYEPNCLFSDTSMGKLVIAAMNDISNLAEVSYNGTPLTFTSGGTNYRSFINWPGAFNKYTDTVTLTIKSINPTTIDESVSFAFRIVDTSSVEDQTLVEIPNTNDTRLPNIVQNWKIKGRPVTPIFTPDTISFCQVNRWITFPESTNKPTSSVYVWTDANNDTVTKAYIGTYGVYDFNVQYYDTTTGCYGNDTLFVIDVASDPNVLRMTSFVYCKEDTTDAFVFADYFTENNPNVSYEYIGIGDPTIWNNNGFPYNGFDTIPSFVAYNPGTEPVVLTYKVIATDVNDTCNSGRNEKEFTITINPMPRIPTSVADMVYCNGTVVNVSESPFPANDGQYIYSWTRIDGDKIFANRADTGTGAFAFTAINNTDSVISATYTIKPSFVYYNESCGVDTVNFTISILPTPTIDPIDQVSVCVAEEVDAVVFSGIATTYNWAKLSGGSNVGLALTSGKDSIPSFIAVNATGNMISATYRITPIFELNGVQCPGTYADYIINVLPAPTVNPIDSQMICSGSKMTAVTFTGSATNYKWRNIGDAITGLPTGLMTGNSISDYTLVNTTTNVQRATIVVYPSNSSCDGDSVTFNIVVYPTPTVNDIASQTVCSQSPTTNVAFTGNADSYTWRNIGSPIVGLPASGVDSLGTHILINNGSSPVTAIIEVTPVSNNGLCLGNVKQFSITVNPEPTLANLPADYVLCSGGRTTGATFTGSANSFTWVATAPSTTTGFPTGTQTGNFGIYTLTNSGTIVDTVKVMITPKSNACSGIPQTFKILVNPQPKITTAPTDQTICSGSSITAVNFTGTGTFNWTVTNGQINGFPTSGTGNIASRVLNNTTTDPQTAEITVTPTYDGCTGTSMIFTITVNPVPTITNKPTDATLCSGDVYSAMTFAGVATEFAWSVTPNGITGFTSTSGTNTFGPFTLTSTTAATATVSVTPKYGTCSAASASTFTITVNPLATVAVTPSDTVVCHNQTVSYNFGANDEWTATGDLITGLGLRGTGPLTAQLENRGTTSLTAIITVAPKSSSVCEGASHQFKITVNPEPVVNNVPAAYTICNNAQTTPFTFAGVATKYEWTVSGNGNINGFPSGTQTGNFGTYMLTNTATTPQTATITVTPYYNHGGTTTCPGATATFEITVNPAVEITNTLNDITLCSGASTNAITFAGATDYEWIVTGDRISGLPTGTQTGNFGSYTVTNNGTTVLTATVTVTPRYIDGGANCAGTSVSFNIIVSPATVITNAYANKTIFCGDETLELTAEATGVNLSYQWYHNGTAISGATSAYYEIQGVQEANAGDYYVIVSSGACGNVQSTQTITVEVRSGDMLFEKWTDIIFVDNYAQRYTAYQWYKDGKILDGATKQFYHEPGGLKGCYYVVLTLASGGTETSCEKCYDNTKLATKDWKLSVYPNPSKQGSNATGILSSNDDVRYDGSLNVTIHNMNGAEVLRMNKVEGQFDVETIQLAPGIYNVKVVTEEGKIYNEKMIVY